MERKPKIGKIGEPIAKQTKMGWVIMSPGSECDITTSLFTKTSVNDYEKLYNIDVLGLEERDSSHEEYVYNKFKEQLKRSDEGWYETGLIWKEGNQELGNNKTASLGRLNNLIKNLNRNSEAKQSYEKVLSEQLENNIIERVSDEANDSYYMPHRPVICSNAEPTKLRIVYDASAKSETGNLLNDCLEKGPTLQNKLWDILIRTRFYPVVLCGDIEKAFLQIRIRESHRNYLRFHWVDETHKPVLYRFTRLVFGLVQSPFILEGTLKYHFSKFSEKYPSVVSAIKDDMYVDDLVTGGKSVGEVANLKLKATELFSLGNFNLHKWHSNESVPESKESKHDNELNFAKQQLGTKANESKILGVYWEKESDQLSVEPPSVPECVTKRSVLQTLAFIYDPLGFISPYSLTGKLIFRKICDLKITWDEKVPTEIEKLWFKWLHTFKERISIPQAIPCQNNLITAIDIHLFSDASKNGVCATAYALVFQTGKISQQLITSKSRLAKQNQSIPRLELIAAHMAANIAQNLKNCLSKFPLRTMHAWTDSKVVLYWLQTKRDYNIFVRNRVNKIKEKDLAWHHVPTKENPADIGSRGVNNPKLSAMWWAGPQWLRAEDSWPTEPIIENNHEAETECKTVKEILATTITDVRIYDNLLEKYTLTKTLRILSWINRFIDNCRNRKLEGPLTTEEYMNQLTQIIKLEQSRYQDTEKFKLFEQQLNLKRNEDHIFKCYGRIQGMHPTFIPPESTLSLKLIQKAHIETIHGGVTLTMAKIRSEYWIPTLRQLTKKVINKCYGCKRFNISTYPSPPQGQLPRDLTNQDLPFKVIGTDFAGPFVYKTKTKAEKKVYILLFTCSLTRAVHLELLPNQSTSEFIAALKRLIAKPSTFNHLL